MFEKVLRAFPQPRLLDTSGKMVEVKSKGSEGSVTERRSSHCAGPVAKERIEFLRPVKSDEQKHAGRFRIRPFHAVFHVENDSLHHMKIQRTSIVIQ